MVAHTQQRQTRQLKGKRSPSTKKRKAPQVSLTLHGPPAVAHHLPGVCPAILTEEGTAIEADGGLTGHLRSIEDRIVELVRKGKGLRTVGGKLGVTPCGTFPLIISFLSPAAVQGQDPDCPHPVHGNRDLRFQGQRVGTVDQGTSDAPGQGTVGMSIHTGQRGGQRAWTAEASV